MKIFLVLVACAVITSAYAAVVMPPSKSQDREVKNEDRHLALQKAAKTMESLGRIFQGDLSASSEEDFEMAFQALESIQHSDFDGDAEEYFFKEVLKAAATSALKAAASELFKKFKSG
uniref:Putative secreted protein n=1 Tax=Amblyomma aureolatum TaxID=187763 RepID=A0A1E1X1V4_9ACAR